MTIGTVLLLEDEPIIALDIEKLLQENGADKVVTLSTCAEAIGWLGVNTPNIAIVDPRLSDGVCSFAVKTLAERSVPFILYSGEPEAAIEREPAFSAGQLLYKPCEPDRLIAALSRAAAIRSFEHSARKGRPTRLPLKKGTNRTTGL
jgi:DNA-binding NtrC family response regulator